MLFVLIPVVFLAVILILKTEKLKGYSDIVYMYFTYYTIFNIVWFFTFKSYMLPNDWGSFYVIGWVLLFHSILNVYLCVYSYYEGNNMLVTSTLLTVLNIMFMFQYNGDGGMPASGRIKMSLIASGGLLLLCAITSIICRVTKSREKSKIAKTEEEHEKRQL